MCCFTPKGASWGCLASEEGLSVDDGREGRSEEGVNWLRGQGAPERGPEPRLEIGPSREGGETKKGTRVQGWEKRRLRHKIKITYEMPSTRTNTMLERWRAKRAVSNGERTVGALMCMPPPPLMSIL